MEQRPPSRPAQPPTPPRAWHAQDAREALAALGARAGGLTSQEAAERLHRFGPNRLPMAGRSGPLLRLALQFHNLLIYVLLIAAGLSMTIGRTTDALVIVAAVITNAVVGFIQESRAERALEAMRGMIDPRCSVLRDGHRKTIAADEVVPGDIVLLEPGDRVAADLRLIKLRNLSMDEAVLTGESVPVQKNLPAVAANAPVGDRYGMAFSGTLVAAGQGVGVVVATATATELGRISSMLSDVKRLRTPLIREINRFTRQLSVTILGISALVFIYAVLVGGYPVDEAFMTMVALVVSAIPEGLPAVITITLAVGVRRMVRHNAVISHLPAVETLGSVSVICSDKTGTLTRNEMTVRSIVTAAETYAVDGVGYAPEGRICVHGNTIVAATHPVLNTLTLAALLCNDAQLHHRDQGWEVEGDPMEGALVTLGVKAGHDVAEARQTFRRLDEIPFDARRRYMASLNIGDPRRPTAYVKGAPEQLLRMCDSVMTAAGNAPLDAAHWQRQIEALAESGQRVIAIARRVMPQGTQRIAPGDVEQQLTLIGLTGLIDPPRPEAVAAIAQCREAGIRVKMITGDHVTTARAIGVQLGLAENPIAVTGQQLAGLDEAAYRACARDASVFARTSPEDKLRLVEALQADGSVIAMTGDGVNDAPALKRADIGIAMGRKGTEAAKEASHMVLTDDNFASIVAAVREGRTVYDNLGKVIAWTLPTSGGEALTIILAIAFGLTLPVSAVQILWINMVTATALGLTLAFEPTEPGTMRRAARAPGTSLLSGRLLWRILFVSILMVCGSFGIYAWSLSRGHSLEFARTMVVNTLVAMEIFYLFSVRYVHGSSLTRQGLLGTPAVLLGVLAVGLAQLAFTFVPALNALLGSAPVGLRDSAVTVAAGVALLLLSEAEKRLSARFWPGAAR